MTEDLIILVADRRLTWSDGRLADDNFTKVVVWRDCFAVAFTGIARINATATKSTSEWIAEVLADYRHFDEGVAALQRRASEQLASLPKWPDMRLGMVVAGFDFRRYPRFALVSNYLPGGPYPADPTDFVRYSMMREVGPGVRSAFATAGVGLENWQEVVLGRPVPRILRQHDGITRAAKIMVALQRKVADKQSGVGRDAMCVVIPRERRGMRGVFARLNARKLHGRHINFCYFEDGTYAFTQLGPHIATGDGRAFGDFYGVADPDNLMNQKVNMKILKTGTHLGHWADIPPDLIPELQNLSLRYMPYVIPADEDDGPYGFGIGF